MRHALLLAASLAVALPVQAKNDTGALKPEAGVSFGGSRGIGSASRYGSSFAAGAHFVVPVHKRLLFGMELNGNTQHLRRDQQNFGRSGRELFDEKINVAQVGALFELAYELSDYLDLRPLLGMGFYQVNTFEGCANQAAGSCAGRDPKDYVDGSNYFGFSYGLKIGFKLGDGLLLGPELRVHQAVGGGRVNSPAFFTPAFNMSARF